MEANFLATAAAFFGCIHTYIHTAASYAIMGSPRMGFEGGGG